MLFKMANRWANNRDEADDLVQDTCVKLLGKAHLYDGRAKFSSWARSG